MASTSVALLMLASGLAAGGTLQAQAGPAPAQARTVAVAPASGTAAAARPNLRACYDGKCRLTLKKSVKFKVSPRFGVTQVAIYLSSSRVRVKATGPGVTSQAYLGRGTSGSVNGIGVRVVSLSGGKAVLSLSPVR
ncbi:hypothetical protein Misp01_48690 [Microtetraspora sp. NBRC 13810]|uniref:hypothetical protein n=1 Tax=Microtetraspora sp. NBRC 13810 TaxID=3030990 RepID=UPI0024A17D3E|nr:hypothetical protein [Microtetraspora sp. NBRC 13810]GLW09740.1 hypothetical protein Misp01_48690 [Microtetraspora sp. NBRC 13810]